MFFIKKLILGIAAIFLIYFGGSGTQSTNTVFQGSGLIGIIIGFVILYLFIKMIWHIMGFLPVIFMICLITGFLLYAIGAFNDGIGNVVPNIKNFLGIDQNESIDTVLEPINSQEEPPSESNSSSKGDVPPISENFDDSETITTQNDTKKEPIALPQKTKPQTPQPERAIRQPQLIDDTQEQESGLSRFLSSLAGKKERPQPSTRFNPNDYPAVIGVCRVINGDTLEMGGRYIKIYGIDAPETTQTCSDARRRSYRCGQEAARWLKGWISGHELECHVLKRDSKGNMVATCSLGQYDIGAALVNAGWAVADTRQTDIYLPYQNQAQNNRNGLWQGEFYTPWDWREIQSAKPKIKIIKPKKKKKGLLDW